jgi:hypothetical protein
MAVAHVPALHFVPSVVSDQHRCYALACNTPISSPKVPVPGSRRALRVEPVRGPLAPSRHIVVRVVVIIVCCPMSDGMPESGSWTWLVFVSLDAAGRRTDFSVFL